MLDIPQRKKSQVPTEGSLLKKAVKIRYILVEKISISLFVSSELVFSGLYILISPFSGFQKNPVQKYQFSCIVPESDYDYLLDRYFDKFQIWVL